MNRRKFVAHSALGALAASTVAEEAAARQKSAERAATAKRTAGAQKKVAPSDTISVGFIGVGSRGLELVRYMSRIPGVRIAALCDIYEPRFAPALALAGAKTPIHRDYRKLLEQSALDAVVVATPPHLHAEQFTAALESGRHLYGEKSMAKTVDECNRIVKAVERSGKQCQVGHQFRYATWFHDVIRRVREGEIGTVTQINGYWYLDNDWRRPVPDPKFERLINWRMYKEFSGGLMTELGSHQMDFANWFFDQMPESVVGSGSIASLRDGRETDDNVQAVFRYPDGRMFIFSVLLNHYKSACEMWVYGTRGSVSVTLEGATFYYKTKAEDKKKVTAEVIERGVPTGASYSVANERPDLGTGYGVLIPEGAEGNPNFVACESFFENIRANKRPFANERVGWRSGVNAILANRAINEGGRITFAEHVKTMPT